MARPTADFAIIDPAELARLREADAALRAPEAMREAGLIRLQCVGSTINPRDWRGPTLAAAILAGRAALVAAGELPPLDASKGPTDDR